MCLGLTLRTALVQPLLCMDIRVSCYATARNVADKSDAELRSLREKGLELVYMGPESGDDRTLHRLAKGGNYAAHVEAAQRVRAAGMKLSTIFLLGAGGVDRWREHAEGMPGALGPRRRPSLGSAGHHAARTCCPAFLPTELPSETYRGGGGGGRDLL